MHFSFSCAVQKYKYHSEKDMYLVNGHVIPLETKETACMEMVPKVVRPLDGLRKLSSYQWSTSRTYPKLPNYSCWANTPTVLLNSVCYYPHCNIQYDMKTKGEKSFWCNVEKLSQFPNILQDIQYFEVAVTLKPCDTLCFE